MSLSRVIIRGLAAKAAPTGEIHKGYFALKKKQEMFQKRDGKPVFLKGGLMDQILYRTTLLLCLVGLGSCGKFYWDMSNPKSE